MKKFIFGIITLLIISCNHKKKKEFSLTGTTNGIKNGTFLYLETVAERKIIDSAKIEDNSFYFLTKLAKTPLRVFLHTKNYSQYRILWIENNEMKFDATDTGFKQANVTGSKTETLKQSFRKEIEGLPRNERQKKEIEFIKDNPKSIASASILSVYSTTWGKEKTKELFKLLSTENKKSEYGKKVSKYIKLNKNPIIGEKYIDFEMEDTNEIPRKLSNLKIK